LPSTTPLRNFYHRSARIVRRKFATKEIPKDDPVRDPFRAYRDPAYYSKIMSENYTRARGWQETFEISLYMKEKKWSFFDLFLVMMLGTSVIWRTAFEPWVLENFTYSKNKMEAGMWHTMFTSQISHQGKFHLVGNFAMICLCVKQLRPLGVNLNYLFGTFILANIGGNLITHLRDDAHIPSMGASAGVACLFMNAVVFIPWTTMEVWLPFMGGWQRNYLWRITLVFMLVDLIGWTFDYKKIGHDAHLVGWILGFVSGCLFKKYHIGLPVNHLWRKPVYKLRKKPPLWDMEHWAKLHAMGRNPTL